MVITACTRLSVARDVAGAKNMGKRWKSDPSITLSSREENSPITSFVEYTDQQAEIKQKVNQLYGEMEKEGNREKKEVLLGEVVKQVVILVILASVIGFNYLIERGLTCLKELSRIWSSPRMTGQGDPSLASVLLL